MTVLMTRTAAQVFAPVTAGGLARGAVMGDAQIWGIEVERYIKALLAASPVVKGGWDASSGTFPGSGSADAGDSWLVTVFGTTGSVTFRPGDMLVALTENASTSTFAGNWGRIPGALDPIVVGSASGTANAITVSSTMAVDPSVGQLLTFVPPSTNTATSVTVTWNGTAYPLIMGDGEIPAIGEIVGGTRVLAKLIGTNIVVLNSPAADQYASQAAESASAASASQAGALASEEAAALSAAAAELAAVQATTASVVRRVWETAGGFVGLDDTVGQFDGQRGEVQGPDSGTHTDPVTEATVDNVGVYSWDASEEVWVRIGDNEFRLVQANLDRVLDADAAAPPIRALFAREVGEPEPNLAFLGDDNAVLAAFDRHGNPLWNEGTTTLAHDSPAPGFVLVDGDGRYVGGFAADGNPQFREGRALLTGAAVDVGLSPSGLALVDGDGRLIGAIGGGGGGLDVEGLPYSQPSADPLRTLPWRDGPYLAVRDPVDELYTRPRAEWFTNLATLYALYDDLMAEFPHYITRTTLGLDEWGNPIHAYNFERVAAIRHPPGVGALALPLADVRPPPIILLSGVHGPERSAQMGNWIVASNLARRWREKSVYDRLRWNARIVIIPAASPTGVDAGTRTNANGVDPNRNHDYLWDQLPSGEGTDNYKGPSVLSEVEAQVLMTIPTVYPNALALIDHHNHFESDSRLIWTANATPALQPLVNRFNFDVVRDLYRLGIAPATPEQTSPVWLTRPIAGNLIGAIAAAGIPAMFVEEPTSTLHPAFIGNTIGLHRLSEALVLRAITAILDRSETQ